jgi:hypothetical protein
MEEVAHFQAVSQYLTETTEERYVGVAYVWVEFRSREPPNTNN